MNKVRMMLVLVLGLSAGVVMAQRADTTKSRHGHHMRSAHGIPNLTEDQKKKIADIKTPIAKEVQQLTNQLDEKRAHLKTLQSADKPDQAAVNATIDDMSKLQAQMMKKRAAERTAIRALLTDEQKLAYDQRGGRGGRKGSRGGHHGRHE